MMADEKPLLIEIVAYAPTAYYHCTHCEVAWRSMGVTNQIHQEQVDSSLPADMAQDYQQLSDWVHEIFKIHCDNIILKVIDAASVEGVFKALQYRLHGYPAIIVDKKHKFSKEQLTDAENVIDHYLHSTPAVQ
jgi:hypothetical protein